MFTIHGYACEIQGESGSGKMEDGHEGAKGSVTERRICAINFAQGCRPQEHQHSWTRVSPVAQIFACHDPD